MLFWPNLIMPLIVAIIVTGYSIVAYKVFIGDDIAELTKSYKKLNYPKEIIDERLKEDLGVAFYMRDYRYSIYIGMFLVMFFGLFALMHFLRAILGF